MSKAYFLKLASSAAFLAAVAFVCVLTTAIHQISVSAERGHNRIYTEFAQELARARDHEAAAKPAQGDTNSPYWSALTEVRRKFSNSKIDIVVSAKAPAADATVLNELRGRSKGWMLTDLHDFWSRSFYVLPTKNLAALEVTTDVRDDLESWVPAAGLVGACMFLLLFCFGWFWSGDAAISGVREGARADTKSEVAERIAAIQKIAAELESGLTEVSAALNELAKRADTQPLEELVAQLRLLVVNGSIEASRASSAPRAFQDIFHELGGLVTRLRAQLGASAGQKDLPALQRRIAEIQRKVSGEEADARPGSSSASSSGSSAGIAFRRVG